MGMPLERMSSMGTKKRKSYTPEYRREAAHLVIDTGRTIAAVAAEINVGAQLLGRWVQLERDRIGVPPEAPRLNLVLTNQAPSSNLTSLKFATPKIEVPWKAGAALNVAP